MKEGLLKGAAKPTLDDFADEHAAAFKKNHDWHVHTDPDNGHQGTMFFAWHRVFLNECENRLRREVPSVTLPYGNVCKDPFPEAVKKISDNEGKSVAGARAHLPDPGWLTSTPSSRTANSATTASCNGSWSAGWAR